MFPANGSLMVNGTPDGKPKAFSDDTKIIGYDPVIMPALIQAELPVVPPFLTSSGNTLLNCSLQRARSWLFGPAWRQPKSSVDTTIDYW